MKNKRKKDPNEGDRRNKGTKEGGEVIQETEQRMKEIGQTRKRKEVKQEKQDNE